MNSWTSQLAQLKFRANTCWKREDGHRTTYFKILEKSCIIPSEVEGTFDIDNVEVVFVLSNQYTDGTPVYWDDYDLLIDRRVFIDPISDTKFEFFKNLCFASQSA